MVDRLVQRLPLQIPQGDVDAADRLHKEALEVATIYHDGEHQFPRDHRVERICTDQHLTQFVDDSGGGLRRQADHAFADAGDTLVGVDPHQARAVALEHRPGEPVGMGNANGGLSTLREPCE